MKDVFDKVTAKLAELKAEHDQIAELKENEEEQVLALKENIRQREAQLTYISGAYQALTGVKDLIEEKEQEFMYDEIQHTPERDE